MYLRKQGPGVVTAGDIVRRKGVTVHNPGTHRDLNDKGKLEIELVVERGVAMSRVQNKAVGRRDRSIPVDSIYSPVLKVTYKVEATRGAAHGLRQADPRRGDQELHQPAGCARVGRQDARRAVRLAWELNLEAEGIEIGPSPQEADHIAAFALPIDDLDLTVRSYNCLKREACTPSASWWAHRVGSAGHPQPVRSPSTRSIKAAPRLVCR